MIVSTVKNNFKFVSKKDDIFVIPQGKTCGSFLIFFRVAGAASIFQFYFLPRGTGTGTRDNEKMQGQKDRDKGQKNDKNDQIVKFKKFFQKYLTNIFEFAIIYL